MHTHFHNTAQEFLDAAGQWLEVEEAVNNLILGLAVGLAKSRKPAVMATVEDSSGLALAALMTPPREIILHCPLEEPRPAAECLAEALLSAGHCMPGCIGPPRTSEDFAKVWCKMTGQTSALARTCRIYTLAQVQWPGDAPGQERLAQEQDIELAVRWAHEFWAEVLHEEDPAATRSEVQQALAEGRMLVWEDQGTAVCMAVAQRPTRHGIGIGYVYTPPEHRRRGYASACVAALSQRQLDAGFRFCCLYADVANPTSNRIYQRIGYRPVADSVQFRFSPAR